MDNNYRLPCQSLPPSPHLWSLLYICKYKYIYLSISLFPHISFSLPVISVNFSLYFTLSKYSPFALSYLPSLCISIYWYDPRVFLSRSLCRALYLPVYLVLYISIYLACCCFFLTIILLYFCNFSFIVSFTPHTQWQTSSVDLVYFV